MLDEEDKLFLRKLFFDVSINKSCLQEKEKIAKENNLSYWESLYKFIIQYRKENIEDDSKLDHWLNFVAPSCVYPNKGFFHCSFCDSFYKTHYLLVRHYKEKHYEQIPKDIFGPCNIFKCENCDVSYFRKEHYIKHLESEKHQRVQMVLNDPTYKTTDLEKIKKTKEKKKFKRECEIGAWEAKKIKKCDGDLDIETNGTLKEPGFIDDILSNEDDLSDIESLTDLDTDEEKKYNSFMRFKNRTEKLK